MQESFFSQYPSVNRNDINAVLPESNEYSYRWDGRWNVSKITPAKRGKIKAARYISQNALTKLPEDVKGNFIPTNTVFAIKSVDESEPISEAVPETISEAVPESVPESTPETTPEAVTESTPEAVTEQSQTNLYKEYYDLMRQMKKIKKMLK